MANLIELAERLDAIWGDDAESRCAIHDAAAALRELAHLEKVALQNAELLTLLLQIWRDTQWMNQEWIIQMRNDISDALKGTT